MRPEIEELCTVTARRESAIERKREAEETIRDMTFRAAELLLELQAFHCFTINWAKVRRTFPEVRNEFTS
jgi:hypothetical protein